MSQAAAEQADPAKTHVATQWQHTSPLICCRFDPSGSYVFAAAEDYTVHRWNTASGDKLSLPGAHDSWVDALCPLPDGQTLLSGGCDGRIIWWPVAAEKPEPQRTIEAHDGWVRCLAASPDGKLVASGGNDRLVKLWNAGDGSLVREFAGHDSHVYSVLYHPSGEWILSGDLKGSVKQWNAASGELVRTFDAKALHTYEGGQAVDYGGVRTMALSPDGKHLACGGLYKGTNPLGAVNEPLVLLFEWESQKVARSHVIEGVQGVAWRVVFHPAGFLIGGIGGSGGGYIACWKPDQDKDFFRLQMPNTCRDLDLHPDGIRLATAHHDRHLRISRMAEKIA